VFNLQRRFYTAGSQINVLCIYLKGRIQMMPLTLAGIGEENTIKKVGGSPEVKKHLENLGFVPGGSVTIINMLGGNVIVNVKESRIAISEEMARKIMI
jgi:feoA family protein